MTLAPTEEGGVAYGAATVPAPPGLDAGTPDITISASAPVSGSLAPDLPVQALYVWCSNTGGTADGQIQSSWVVYAGAATPGRVLGTLTPQEPSGVGDHVAYFDATPGAFRISTGAITTGELFYGAQDPTCCPSGRATTVWAWDGHTFAPRTTVQAQPGSGQ